MRRNRFAAETVAVPMLVAATELARQINAMGGTLRLNDDGMIEVAVPPEHVTHAFELVAAFEASR